MFLVHFRVVVDVNKCLILFKLFVLLHARTHGILINSLIKERCFVRLHSILSGGNPLCPNHSARLTFRIPENLLKFLLISSELSLINFTQISAGEIEGSYLSADSFLGMAALPDNRLTDNEARC